MQLCDEAGLEAATNKFVHMVVTHLLQDGNEQILDHMAGHLSCSLVKKLLLMFSRMAAATRTAASRKRKTG
jgi:hypothetical protein